MLDRIHLAQQLDHKQDKTRQKPHYCRFFAINIKAWLAHTFNVFICARNIYTYVIIWKSCMLLLNCQNWWYKKYLGIRILAFVSSIMLRSSEDLYFFYCDPLFCKGTPMLTLVLLNPAFANSVNPDQLASEEANWSGSALFALSMWIHIIQSGSSNLIGWKLEVGVAS